MIRKMVASSIFICLIIAIPLSLMGFTKVELGEPFLALMKSTSVELNTYKIAIPSIPRIPLQQYEQPAWYESVLNFLIKFVNFLSTITNFVITILNYIIQLLEFIFLLIRNIRTFKDSIQQAQTHAWRVMAIASSQYF